jgi:hypothetical protein
VGVVMMNAAGVSVLKRTLAVENDFPVGIFARQLPDVKQRMRERRIVRRGRKSVDENADGLSFV